MNIMRNWIAGLGVLGFFLVLACFLFVLGVSVYGLVLAFSASVLLGIVVLIIEPAPFIIGLVSLLGGFDLAQRIVEFFSR